MGIDKQGLKKWLRRGVLTICLIAGYIITSVPVGLFVYTLKSDLGYNVFNATGYHGFLSCLENEGRKVQWR